MPEYSQLPTTSAALFTDIQCVEQGGLSVQETLQQQFNLFLPNTIILQPGSPIGAVTGIRSQIYIDTVALKVYVCTVTGTSPATTTWFATSLSGLITPSQGGTGVANPTANTIPIANGSSNFNFIGPLTNGQIPIGSTGNTPVAATITGGSNITVTNSAGGITIGQTSTTGILPFTVLTTTSQTIAVNNAYIANDSSLITFTLPTTAAVGTAFIITGLGVGGWTIAQNANQLIKVGTATSTTGTGGSVASTNAFDSAWFVCTVANLQWQTLVGPQGNLLVT